LDDQGDRVPEKFVVMAQASYPTRWKVGRWTVEIRRMELRSAGHMPRTHMGSNWNRSSGVESESSREAGVSGGLHML
jgi:hypothetical protein